MFRIYEMMQHGQVVSILDFSQLLAGTHSDRTTFRPCQCFLSLFPAIVSLRTKNLCPYCLVLDGSQKLEWPPASINIKLKKFHHHGNEIDRKNTNFIYLIQQSLCITSSHVFPPKLTHLFYSV